MSQNSKKPQNGKGSSPRSCFSKAFKSNYDEINWCRDVHCDDCGALIKYSILKTRPELFEFNPDKTVRHKNCNYN